MCAVMAIKVGFPHASASSHHEPLREAGPEEVGTEEEGTKEAGTEVEGSEQVGTEVLGTEEAGTEEEGTEEAGTGEAGTEEVGTACFPAEEGADYRHCRPASREMVEIGLLSLAGDRGVAFWRGGCVPDHTRPLERGSCHCH